MTDHNNAAQPGLTDDQIEALAKKHIAPHADRLEAIMTNPVPYQQTEQFRRVKALIGDLLSKLRAEGVQAGDEGEAFLTWANKEYGIAEGYELNESQRDVLENKKGWMARAALASDQVAENASVVWKHTHRISGVIELSMEDLEGNAFNREKWESVPHYSVPQASAPVAGEADQPDIETLRRIGAAHDARNAAPQASEAVRDAGIDLEAAAKTLAECMDYPWAEMPEQGRTHMRQYAQSVVDAALSAQPGAQKGKDPWQNLAEAFAQLGGDIPNRNAGEWLELSGRVWFDPHGVAVSGLSLISQKGGSDA